MGPSVEPPTGHETLTWAGEPHAPTPTGAFGGAPYGAAKRCPGLGNRMRPPPLGPSVELPLGHETLPW
eukprot:9466147-Pyramimonas_sp.AAC.1